MRVAFFGTSAFGAGALHRLVAQAGIDLVAVVSQPDRPAGRGRRTASPPVAVAAAELGLPLDPVGASERRPALRPTLGAVVAFGQILRPPLLGRYPLFNLHPSLLPRWRGAAPIERALMAGDTETGVAVIELVAELDAGPVHALERFPIGPDDDAGARCRARARPGRAAPGRRPCAARRPGASRSETSPTPPRSRPATGTSTGTPPAAAVANQVRALAPHIGARAEFDGRPGHVMEGARTRHARGVGARHRNRPSAQSRCRLRAEWAPLEVLELQPAGKRRMAVGEYLRGLRTPPARAT